MNFFPEFNRRLAGSPRSILVLLAVIVAIVVFVDLPGDSELWREVQNSGHSVAFALVAWLVLSYRRLSRRPVSKVISQYLFAFWFSLAAGLAVEVVQLFLHRDASWADFARDAGGIVAMLALSARRDPRLTITMPRRHVFSVSAVAAIVLCLLPLAITLIDYRQRDSAFPLLVDFQARWPIRFLSVNDANLASAHAPAQWPGDGNEVVGYLSLQPARYPGLSVHEPVADWRAYSSVKFALYSEHVVPFKLIVRIHDRRHNNKFKDRFNHSLLVQPGFNFYRIPLDEVRKAPEGRQMDMAHIAGLSLFADHNKHPIAFYLSSIYLSY